MTETDSVTFAAIAKRVGLMTGGIVVLLVALAAVQPALHALHVPDAFAALIVITITLGVYYGYRRLSERRPPDDIAPRQLALLMLGWVAGGMLFAVVIALLAAVGMYDPVYVGVSGATVSALLLAFAIAAAEEAVFRGFLFRTVQGICGTWIAVVASAVLFGALHAANPGATVATSAAIALEAGVLLALAYAATGSLWLPIGIHAGWNFCEGTIFGTAVSGHAVAHSTVFRGALLGYPVLTGGIFGPEAGVFAVVVCVLAAAVLAIYAMRTGRILSPAWRKA